MKKTILSKHRIHEIMKSLSEILGWIRFLSDTSSFDCVNIFTDVSIFSSSENIKFLYLSNKKLYQDD